MRGRRRLGVVVRALCCPPPTGEIFSQPLAQAGRHGDSNANLTLEEQLFVFDLQGFVVLENVLQAHQVDELDALIDAQNVSPGTPEILADRSAGSRVRFGSSGGGRSNTGPGLLGWGQPFVDLLDHATVAPFLAALIPRQDGLGTHGAGVRLDRLYGIHQDKATSGILPTGTGLGGFHRDFEATYDVKMGTFQNSFIVVSWALSDSGGSAGGFVCFPGSHKQNFPMPESFRRRTTLLPPGSVSPRIKKGSVLIFTEALTHGTMPWKAPWTRRTLLYKYAQKHVLFMQTGLKSMVPRNANLSPHQQLLLEPPSRMFPGWHPEGQ